MKEIHQHQREWFSKWTANRFVFMGNGPEGPPQAEVEQEASKAEPEAQTAEALKPEDFDGHVKQFQGRLDNLKTAYQKTSKLDEATETKNLGEIDSAFTKINDGYQARLRILEKNYNTQVTKEKQKYDQAVDKIAQKFTPKIQSLISKVEGRITEAGPIPVETTEERVRPERAERPEVREGAEREPLKKGLEKARDQLVTIMEKYITEGKIPTLGKADLKTETFQTYINYILNRLKPEQIKRLEAGEDFPATKEEISLVMEACRFTFGMEELSDKNEDEMKLVRGLKLDGKEFKDIFGEDSSIPEMLSRKYKIEKGEGDQIKFIEGKEERVISSISDLRDLLPQNQQEQFDALIKAEEPTDEMRKALQKLAQVEAGRLDALNTGIQGLGKQIEGLAGKEGVEKMGVLGSIGMLLALWKSIMEAINSDPPDMTTLTEFLEDWNEAKSPKALAKKVEQSKNSYTECMEALKKKESEPHSISTLLQAYLNPRGPEADKLFGVSKVEGRGVSVDPKHPMARHRPQAKPAILDYVQEQLGVNIGSIDKGVGNQPVITAYTKDVPAKKIEITLGATTEAGTEVNVIVPAEKEGEEPKPLLDEPTVTVKTMKELQERIAGKKPQKKPKKVVKERPEGPEKGQEITDEMREDYVNGLTNKKVHNLIKALRKADLSLTKAISDFYKDNPKLKPSGAKDYAGWAKFRKAFIIANLNNTTIKNNLDSKLKPAEPTERVA